MTGRAATGSRRRPAELGPRTRPRQERAKRTVERVLAVAGAVLDEVGPAAFNTNLLAVRAGVRVRTVYRYFPNKEAVIAALARRLTARWDAWLGGFAILADPAADWRHAWAEQIALFHDGVRALPGGTAVRRAMQASPELRVIDQADNARLARQLARALRRRGAPLSVRRAEVVARTLIETAVAVIDLAMLGGGARQHLDELARMHVRYLEDVLGDAARVSTRRARG